MKAHAPWACALLCLLSAAESLPSPPSTQWIPGQIINTTSGRFQGHPAHHQPNVSAYLGVPYAQPPVGHLRFKAPQKYTDQKKDVVKASTFGASCPQDIVAKSQFPGESPDGVRILNNNEGIGQHVSENCLTLNIWTKPQTGEAKKAILMFIYGGGFSGGISNNPSTNGRKMADEEDVVVVTFNYRTGIFGFLGLPGYEQNAGLLDQRAAVEWVRNNAEAFGGDPSRITLMGQSAGSASVDFYSYAWTADPIVNSFIEESGSATSFGEPATNSTGYFYELSSAVGCGGKKKAIKDALACVEKKPWKALIAATPKGEILSAFAPTVDNKVVFADYATRAEKGDFIKKPYLIGNNNNEEGYFNATMGGTFTRKSGKQLNVQLFNCPTAMNAALRAKSGVTTYRYRYFGDFPNLRLYPSSGAYHTSELSIIFGMSRRFSGSPNTPFEEHWSTKMRGLWAGFAKDAEGVSVLGLRQYEPKGETLNILAKEGQGSITYEPETAYDSGCPTAKSSA